MSNNKNNYNSDEKIIKNLIEIGKKELKRIKIILQGETEIKCEICKANMDEIFNIEDFEGKVRHIYDKAQGIEGFVNEQIGVGYLLMEIQLLECAMKNCKSEILTKKECIRGTIIKVANNEYKWNLNNATKGKTN